MEVPKERGNQLAFLIEHLSEMPRHDTVTYMDDCVLHLYRNRADKLLSTTHDALHIIRDRRYFTDSITLTMLTTKSVSLYDYMTDDSGFYYNHGGFVEDLIEKLTHIHHLLEDPDDVMYSYYMRHMEPILHDVGILLVTMR